MCARLFSLVTLLLLPAISPAEPERIVIGGKNFNESSILAEIMAQLLEAQGFSVERRLSLGGTLICFEALRNGEIDIYPEYSGTLEQNILHLPGRVSYQEIRRRTRQEYNLELLAPFGFNNTYAMAMERDRAAELGIKTISDLRNCRRCKLGFSLEFLNRPDGWIGLQRAYNLPQKPRGMEHGLAYLAIQSGDIDVTDAYSTDGDIPKFDLVILEDDRDFFPRYLGAPLVRAGLPDAAKAALGDLAHTLDDASMQQLNARVVVDGKSFAEVAADFLHDTGLVTDRQVTGESFWALLWRRTARHIYLTVVALICAMLLAIPTGVLIYRREPIARPVIYVTGLLQTIPSIALLAFMIPLLGIGVLPAVVALFLYSLLPILRNTVIALFSVDPLLKNVSTGMGMTTWQRLRFVELPLAAPTILAGIRTAAVITIGTATLAAFIGAGGLGEPIVTGLYLNNTRLILQGAIPAALLAVLVEILFEIVEKLFIPAHLQQKPGA